jgi:EAL domain-containing protein (putative c-di-GMP-specific phosphodiesterase class I)/DNA-binding NarL/FixJ family response regulator
VSQGEVVRVLLAEDDPVVLEALSALINDEPALELVSAVSDTSAAVEAAARERPNVALVDVRMPGGGGAEAARGIRRRSPETRVLALSAYDDRATVLEMLEAGVVGYLVKGSSIDSIMDAIAQAADGQGSLSVEVTGEVIDELVGQLQVRRRATERKRGSEMRIRSALEQEGALSMVFQPICTLGGGDPVGVEALARFRGPPVRRPERWFEEAEAVGLRRELELAAIKSAVAELERLPAGLYLSVNASPETLRSAALRKLLARTDGERIVVELTEHARIDDYKGVNGALARIRELGVRLAIDDAGAGFASLRHILRLAPEIIKLDRTLIDQIETDRSRQALAAGLISFASRIDATIIAEGIERSAEVEALLNLGVSYGQGFFFAKPAPLAELSLEPSSRKRRAAAG